MPETELNCACCGRRLPGRDASVRVEVEHRRNHERCSIVLCTWCQSKPDAVWRLHWRRVGEVELESWECEPEPREPRRRADPRMKGR